MIVLYWAPRILSIIFAGFISLFALDVFNEGHSFWETLLALAVHLIPTALCYCHSPCLALGMDRYTWFLGPWDMVSLVSLGEGDWVAYMFILGPLFLPFFIFPIGCGGPNLDLITQIKTDSCYNQIMHTHSLGLYKVNVISTI